MENHYELLYIVSVKYLEDELQKVRDAVKKVLEDNSAQITLDEIFAKQKLAYPIKQVHQGTYVVIEFDMEGANLLEVDKQVKLMPEILRHMIITKKIKSAEELAQEKRLQETLKQEQAEHQAKQDAKESRHTSPRKPNPKTADVEVKEKPAKEKASLEKLDEKLDEILEKDVMK